MQVLYESPEKKSVVLRSHGMLPILEILETNPPRDIVLRLLKIINMVILEDTQAQEMVSLLNSIPIISNFAHKKYSSEIRKEAAAFVRQMYQTSMFTLQLFIGCGGINVLVEFLEEDIDTERDLVLIGVNGVWSVFEYPVRSFGLGLTEAYCPRAPLQGMNFVACSPNLRFCIHSHWY